MTFQGKRWPEVIGPKVFSHYIVVCQATPGSAILACYFGSVVMIEYSGDFIDVLDRLVHLRAKVSQQVHLSMWVEVVLAGDPTSLAQDNMYTSI